MKGATPVPGPTMIMGMAGVGGRAEVRRALHEDLDRAVVGAVGEIGGADALAVAAEVVGVADDGDGEADLAGVRERTGGDGVQPGLEALEDAGPVPGTGTDGGTRRGRRRPGGPSSTARARPCCPGAAAACRSRLPVRSVTNRSRSVVMREMSRRVRSASSSRSGAPLPRSTGSSGSHPVRASHSATRPALLAGQTPSASPAS